MERKIGEIFEYDGEWYQCIPDTTDDNCNNCFFQKSCSDIAGDCSSTARSDGKTVAFKKLEKVGEPFSCNYYGDSRLVMMQEYQLFDSNVIYCYQTPPMYITDYKHKRIAIEIKQNKEDMGEEKEDIRPYDKYFSQGTVSNTEHLAKMSLKPFDLEAAKAGKPVCTRDGRRARIICFDRKFLYEGQDYCVVALINEGCYNEVVCSYTKDGLHDPDEIHGNDLMMLPEKKEGWVNVYKDSVYDTKDEALIGRSESRGYIDTIKISWKE